MSEITADDVFDSVSHWLNTPANSMLGSDYGNNSDKFIGMPMVSSFVNEILRKLRTDLPILQAIPQNAIYISEYDNGLDAKNLVITVLGRNFLLNG